jgi:hypothetical protein
LWYWLLPKHCFARAVIAAPAASPALNYPLTSLLVLATVRRLLCCGGHHHARCITSIEMPAHYAGSAGDRPSIGPLRRSSPRPLLHQR